MISASEVSTKYFTNTFDDQYDDYLPSSNQRILSVINIALNSDFVSTIGVDVTPNLNYNYISVNILNEFHRSSPPKLFLKNSLLLI